MNETVSIGVVGTAKNTGKTTTLSHLIDQAHRNGLNSAVTGIGYDGEEIDNITMLPKPRLHLHEGTILTTSEVCLKRSPIGYRVIRRTGIPTALGELLIVEVTKSGLIVVAGPNKVTSLRIVLEHMRELQRDVVFVDGSINRMMPMSVVDKLIFATGAARNVEIPFLTAEMNAIAFLFQPDVHPEAVNPERVTFIRENGDPVEFTFRSVIDSDDVDMLQSHFNTGKNTIVIPGMISKAALKQIDKNNLQQYRSTRLVLSSPFPLLLTENPVDTVPVIESLIRNGITISYIRKPQLTGVTINPFYPRYEREQFSSAYIDKEKLMKEMQDTLSVPVFNVKEDIGDRLFELCYK